MSGECGLPIQVDGGVSYLPGEVRAGQRTRAKPLGPPSMLSQNISIITTGLQNQLTTSLPFKMLPFQGSNYFLALTLATLLLSLIFLVFNVIKSRHKEGESFPQLLGERKFLPQEDECPWNMK